MKNEHNFYEQMNFRFIKAPQLNYIRLGNEFFFQNYIKIVLKFIQIIGFGPNLIRNLRRKYKI